MKRLATICLATICLTAFGQVLTRTQKADIILKSDEFAAKVRTDVLWTPRDEVSPGVFCMAVSYKGPKGLGHLVYVWADVDGTNKVVRIIDTGPEGRGREIK